MSELQSYYDTFKTGQWAHPDPRFCRCNGSGWALSEVDTWHKCRFHYVSSLTGDPDYNEGEPENGWPLPVHYCVPVEGARCEECRRELKESDSGEYLHGLCQRCYTDYMLPPIDQLSSLVNDPKTPTDESPEASIWEQHDAEEEFTVLIGLSESASCSCCGHPKRWAGANCGECGA
jgi:hypothetical protein